ncbi:MAG: pyrophosphorylase [bacterium P3]|nr:MAG: pyrophosphorylase [bacterium P3]KWW41935.1 MAG: pyrophosphorylase [bacterium F083]
MKNIAIVLAAGNGSRMGGALPKQFLELEGRPVVAHCIDAFDRAPAIDEVAVVTHPGYRDLMQSVLDAGGWRKAGRLITGGDERHLSSFNAIRAYAGAGDDVNLIFHDAARPWVSQRIIARVADALLHHEAVGVAIPCTDTVWQTSGSTKQRRVAAVPDRSTLCCAQTPQAFRRPLIDEAYRRLMEDTAFKPTDDCSVVLRYMPQTVIHVVEGEAENRKITYSCDI